MNFDSKNVCLELFSQSFSKEVLSPFRTNRRLELGGLVPSILWSLDL